VIIINSLPAEYGNVLEQWEQLHPSMKNFEFLITQLKNKEEGLNRSGKNQLFTVRRYSPEEWKDLPVSEKKKLSRCKKCGIKGHWATDCKATAMVASTEGSKTGRAKTTKSVDSFCMKCSEVGRSVKGFWIADPGATAHMSHNKNWFESLNEFKIPETCRIGDGTEVKIMGKGVMCLQSEVGNEIRPILLHNVLWIPELTTNIVSIGKATEQGYHVNFSGRQVLHRTSRCDCYDWREESRNRRKSIRTGYPP